MATCDLCYAPCEYGARPYCSNPGCKHHDKVVELRLGTPNVHETPDQRYLKAHGRSLIESHDDAIFPLN